jgi:hypothetical protein
MKGQDLIFSSRSALKIRILVLDGALASWALVLLLLVPFRRFPHLSALLSAWDL